MANGKVGAPAGNQNGAKQNRMWADAIRKCIVQGKSLDRLALKLVDMAIEGDMAAIKEIGDRLDGKAVQQVVGGGEDGEHVVHFTWQEQ